MDPVLVALAVTGTTAGMSSLQVALSLGGVVLIIVAAYYTTWYIGAKATGKSRNKLRNRYINIIDRFAISKDKSFCLVEIAGKVYIIGMTNQSMTVIDTMDAAAVKKAAAERHDTGIWPAAAGGGFKSRATKGLAAFIAKRTGRPYEHFSKSDNGDFEENMRYAREKNEPGQSDSAKAGRADDVDDADDD